MNNNYNLNKNTENEPKPGFDFRIILFLTVNGIATGRIIAQTTQMIQHGYDNNTMTSTLLYLLLFTYSAQRIYEIHTNNKNNQNNKQR